MPRYALKIEYNGAPFSGWQRQKEETTVQGTIEAALAKIEPRVHQIAAAGRTDAGVHALGQVAHADMERDWSTFRLSEALNYHLRPAPIAIVGCAIVPDEWHARFGALERHYLFRLCARRAPVIHDQGAVWQVKNALNLEAMREGAALLVGKHDFTTFRSTICQAASPIKTLDEIAISAHPIAAGIEYHFHLRARSFLHNQVRSIVGTLERVGAGSWAPEDITNALAARDRAACGPVCPPHGLYLQKVVYPEDPFA